MIPLCARANDVFPANPGNGQRIELRSPDSAANPYLAIAVCLAAGLDGIRNRILPPAPVEANIFHLTEEEREARGIACLPENLMEAVCWLQQDPVILEALGEHLARKYIQAKKQEWKDYCSSVTDWEIERYLARI